MESPSPFVVLGFRSPLPPPALFPSKVGGAPAWLHPAPPSELVCSLCKAPLDFLLQLYCPLAHPYAYHRTLFVFVCLSNQCTGNSIRVVRSQLPAKNQFYPEQQEEEPKQEASDSENEDPVALFMAESSPPQNEENQEEQPPLPVPMAKKESEQLKQPVASEISPAALKGAFPEFSIESEEEASEVTRMMIKESQRIASGKGEIDEDCEELYMSHSSKGKAERMVKQYEQEGEGADDDADQEELQDLASPEFQLFQAVSSQFGGQILRYKRSQEAPLLLFAPDDRKMLAKLCTKCKRCGGPMLDELQIMPQLLAVAGSEKLAGLDWAYAVVRTQVEGVNFRCEQSCISEEAYVQEEGVVILEAEADVVNKKV